MWAASMKAGRSEMGEGKHLPQPGAQKLLEEESSCRAPPAPDMEHRARAVSIPDAEFTAGPEPQGAGGAANPRWGRAPGARAAVRARRAEHWGGDRRLCTLSGAQGRGWFRPGGGAAARGAVRPGEVGRGPGVRWLPWVCGGEGLAWEAEQDGHRDTGRLGQDWAAGRQPGAAAPPEGDTPRLVCGVGVGTPEPHGRVPHTREPGTRCCRQLCAQERPGVPAGGAVRPALPGTVCVLRKR